MISVVLGLLIAGMSLADSSVRPPGNAVNLPEPDALSNTLGERSDSDVWRSLKAGNPADPATFGQGQPDLMAPGSGRNIFTGIWDELNTANSTETSTTGDSRLMQVLGEDWRLFRRDYILKYSHWVLLGVLTLLVLFRLIRGRIMIRGGRSGKVIPRFSMAHRIAHWFLAGSFIMMSLSGLIILLGRPLLVPLIGKEANAVLNSAALQGHNLFGPVFIMALLIVTFRFMRGNFFQRADIKWIIKGGGLLGGHASSNHYNFGEKAWYWMVVIIGLIMSATGLFLLFPWLSDTLAWHQLSTILHAIGAIILISVALGHAYIGTIGMEGSIDSMLRGEVDENWAKEHHDLWYEELTGNKVTHDEPEEASADTQAENMV